MRELDTYTSTLKTKKMIHHLERIPIPFPLTIAGLVVLVLLEIIMFKWVPFGNPLVKYIVIPVGICIWISYHEPEGINIFQQIYRKIRRWFKPRRRKVNRSIPLRGVRKEYPQMTYIHLDRREEHDPSPQ
ncbi:TcpE family conjugal transfer membrane protein [Desmospora activa]|uniref:TcpE family protein n=1 Tax=Desmospora activa DSM 45169 TaxID=1121389 RepID=A0A2T4YZM8_9BACL|nr:TcpE family conjugal transfer membrane protein [Desmospora activa]PTM52714.1 TcpE family protein [Desmospora activa DSM 45169]